MDVSPATRQGVLLRLGEANAEVRDIQAQLYKSIVKQTITVDTLKTHAHVLDTDIKIIFSCEYCYIKRNFEENYGDFGFSYHNQTSEQLCKYVDMIKTGFCDCSRCRTAKVLGDGVVGLRLIHVLTLSDKNLPIIAFLHECGCDMNPLTLLENHSPLLLAVNSRSKEIVRYYVKHFDCIQFAPMIQKALVKSIGDADITEVLLSSKHTDVNFCGEDGRSLLVTLLDRNEYRCDDVIDNVRVYLEAGADLMLTNEHGNTSLMIATKFGCVQTVKLLLKHGSNVDTVNKTGDTALHLAALCEKSFFCGDNLHGLDYLDENEARIVELLLEHGANPEIVNDEGATPLWYAVFQDCFEVVQTLLAASVEIDLQVCGKPNADIYYRYSWEPRGSTGSLLEVALKKADIDIIMLLREAGYDIHKQMKILNKETSLYDNYYDENTCGDSVYKNLIDDWIVTSQSPRTLESLCRAKVRKCLGYKIHKNIEQLDIPKQIKNSLLFRDILPSQRRLDSRIDTDAEDYDGCCSESAEDLEDGDI